MTYAPPLPSRRSGRRELLTVPRGPHTIIRLVAIARERAALLGQEHGGRAPSDAVEEQLLKAATASEPKSISGWIGGTEVRRLGRWVEAPGRPGQRLSSASSYLRCREDQLRASACITNTVRLHAQVGNGNMDCREYRWCLTTGHAKAQPCDERCALSCRPRTRTVLQDCLAWILYMASRSACTFASRRL